jgi:hydroxyethylthiazole kinase-like uncharacterized protein yjeF
MQIASLEGIWAGLRFQMGRGILARNGGMERLSLELLTPEEMGEADRLAIHEGPFDGYGLMRNAGASIATALLGRFPGARRVHVLCGPGNNGGDGFVVARLLRESGVETRVHCESVYAPQSDAGRALAALASSPLPFAAFDPSPGDVVVDALFGAGLARAIEGAFADVVDRTNASGASIVAVDLPSGVSGASGKVLGKAMRADLTVTFFRKKPGHLLQPGRSLCGETVVADIGIPARVLDRVAPACFENGPLLWAGSLASPSIDTHKYRRGHVGVFSGGPTTTGACRLSAMAAARVGAGAVTVLSPGSALAVNAAHLTSIMLRRVDDFASLEAFMAARPRSAYVIGPAFGIGERLRAFARALLEGDAVSGVVLDADAFSSFSDDPAALFGLIGTTSTPVALTPHEGEFGRLFPDIAADNKLSKLDMARAAARLSRALVVFKGPDTVIAAPDGRAAINANGSPWLATAGSGDVLAGLVAGLLSRGISGFEAACAGVWLHAEAARRFGEGLTAEDLPGLLPAVLRGLRDNPA